jgi:uncharacterized spore protein YtfJ
MSELSHPTVVEQGVNHFFATFERAQNSAGIQNVYGQPVTYGESVVIPVASVSQMFGLGLGIGSSGSEADEAAQAVAQAGIGGGGTGRVTARPVAMAEITPDGLDIHPVIDENRAVVAGVLFAAWAVFWAARTLIKLFK